MVLRQGTAQVAVVRGAYRAALRRASTRAGPRKRPANARQSTTPPLGNGDAQAARIARHRAVPLVLAATVAFGMGVYVMQLWATTRRAADGPTVIGPRTQAELTCVYDETAATFDAEVDMSEWLMGVKKQRKQLAGKAQGHVLEVSCGTARNLGYYQFGETAGVKSLTLADLSMEMVQVGKQKWSALRSKGKLEGQHKGIPVRFWHGDVKGSLPPPPAEPESGRAPSGYDTIVQSMGLCSTDEPVELLRNLASHLNTVNPEARILLLEHGRSYYPWWNGVLDSQAATHASKHGCWWNRDIGEIVQQSGLEIVSERRRNFGTTWVFELRPGKAADGTTAGSGQIKAMGDSTWGAWVPRWAYEKICKR